MGKDRDYEVGDGKPPMHSRFQKGQSGNPKGRPKGAKNLRTELLEEMHERVQVTENGRARKLTKKRILLKAAANKAISGNIPAAVLILGMLTEAEGHTSGDGRPQALPEEDAAILAAFVEFASRAADGETGDNEHGK